MIMQIGTGKQGVRIGEYGTGKTGLTDGVSNDRNAVIGWIEPACDNPQWILWFTNKGDAVLHRKRSPTGGVQDEPLKIKATKRA